MPSIGTHTLQRLYSSTALYSLYSSTALHPLQYTTLYNTPLVQWSDPQSAVTRDKSVPCSLRTTDCMVYCTVQVCAVRYRYVQYGTVVGTTMPCETRVGYSTSLSRVSCLLIATTPYPYAHGTRVKSLSKTSYGRVTPSYLQSPLARCAMNGTVLGSGYTVDLIVWFRFSKLPMHSWDDRGRAPTITAQTQVPHSTVCLVHTRSRTCHVRTHRHTT